MFPIGGNSAVPLENDFPVYPATLQRLFTDLQAITCTSVLEVIFKNPAGGQLSLSVVSRRFSTPCRLFPDSCSHTGHLRNHCRKTAISPEFPFSHGRLWAAVLKHREYNKSLITHPLSVGPRGWRCPRVHLGGSDAQNHRVRSSDLPFVCNSASNLLAGRAGFPGKMAPSAAHGAPRAPRGLGLF